MSTAFSRGRSPNSGPALVAVSTAAVVTLIAFAALFAHTWWTGRQQAELARQFGQEVNDIEWLMRASMLSPPHDITADLLLIEDRMAGVERVMRGAGAFAQGPGLYALGRGELARGDPLAATARLEEAWNANYREPEVAYALGLAMAMSYQRELEALAAISGKTDREARYLRAIGEDPSAALEQANEQIDRALELNPTHTGFLICKIDMVLLAARAGLSRGLDPTPHLDAVETIAAEHLVGDLHSPEFALAAARSYYIEARWLDSRGLDPGPSRQAGLDACALALTRNGQHGESLAVKALLELSDDAGGDLRAAAEANALDGNPLLDWMYGFSVGGS